MPIATQKWPHLPAFFPSYQTALIGAYAITAYLLFGYFQQTKIRSMLWLWSGCVYTAGVLLAQFLSVPGTVIANVRLLGGAQTTIWLWFFWHLGASGMLLGYAVAEWRRPGALVADAKSAFYRAAGLTAAALTVSLLAVTRFHDVLPVEDVAGDFSRITSTGYAPLIQAIVFAALFALWRGTRFRTPVSAWLGVAMVALAFDNAITMAGGTRLSIGWYVGRLNALFAALVMLALYLKEVNRVYLAAAANAGQLALAKAELERHQERLETLVRDRTQSLEDTQNALLHAQKLEAIGKLTGGVAHDFNNVLHIISGNLDLIRLFSGANDKVLLRCSSAQDAVRRGAKLSSQLLSFARKQPLQPVPTDLAQVFGNMDMLLKRAVGERVDIELVRDAAVGNVNVDPQQLENVFLNLALNASDAMPQGGRLTVALRDTKLSDDEAARLMPGGGNDYVCIAFTDTGSGMNADVMTRAFEPFFSTKEVGKGTGLGLSMAYGFVKQSGGHIDIDSSVSHGTTIRILLPRTGESAIDKKTAPVTSISGGHEIVLVVDDEVDIQDNVGALLTELGYRVLKASSADEARRVLSQHPQIDLLFTDVIMPGVMTSPQLAALARQLHPAIRVLFTSGYSEDAVIHDGRLDEGVNLLSKPYGRDELARAIRATLAQRNPGPPEALQQA
ncbi:MAG: MASE4 domain-containing protein [Pseudomonadota bacterium]|nr:MASE4 domain-containing protein [Pseudomonadota bacterium]